MDAFVAFLVAVGVIYVAVIKPRLKRGCRTKPHGVQIEPSREAMDGPYDHEHPMAWPLLDPQYLNHHGWERVGPVDKADQRSLWIRLQHLEPECDSFAHEPCGYVDDTRTVTWIEIRGGHQGSDFYMRLERGDAMFEQILNLCTLCRSIASADHLNTVFKESYG